MIIHQKFLSGIPSIFISPVPKCMIGTCLMAVGRPPGSLTWAGRSCCNKEGQEKVSRTSPPTWQARQQKEQHTAEWSPRVLWSLVPAAPVGSWGGQWSDPSSVMQDWTTSRLAWVSTAFRAWRAATDPAPFPSLWRIRVAPAPLEQQAAARTRFLHQGEVSFPSRCLQMV